MFTGLQLANADVALADLIRPLAPGDPVHLEADESVLVHLVGEVCASHSVHPGAVAIALNHDSIEVPVIVLEGFLPFGLDLADPFIAA